MTKEEKAAYKKEWRKKNIERIKAYDRERYTDEKRKADTLKRVSAFNQTDKRKEWKESNKEKIAAKAKEYKDKQKDKKEYIKRFYGIEPSEYQKMFEQQEGKCFICSTHNSQLKRPLSVDHCHKTGKIRKLLCNGCNTAIGLLKEDPTIVNSLIKYLQLHV